MDSFDETTRASSLETILLVEDDPSIRMLLGYELSHAGYTVLSASMVEEALKLCKEYDAPIQLLITDLALPQGLRLAMGRPEPTLAGLDLAAEALKLRPSLQVLFISGQPEEVLERFQVRQVAATLLRKPFGSDTLLRAVRALLSLPVKYGWLPGHTR
ncbi:response regulator [Candidatus Nitrospira bockiana]